MASLTLRIPKGEPLTNAEIDANFSNLNADAASRLLASSNLSDLANAATARTNLGLGNVENKSSATIRSELTSLNVTGALGFTPLSDAGGTVSGALTLSAGTANGVAYLNGSKVLTTGSALTFDGTTLGVWDLVSGNFNRLLITQNSGLATYNQTYSYGSTNAHVWQIGGSEQMRLTSTGLGIGTSSITAIYGKTLQIGSGGSENTVSLVGPTGSVFLATVGATGQLIARGGTALQFGANDSVHATLSTSGNLGLGVTPSAWSGYGLPVLELPSGGTIVSAGTSQNLGANWYYSGGSFLYKTTAAATYFQQASGAFKWYTAPSGTAGNAISFTQAMTLTAAGDLGIGTSSPGYKLDVVGFGRFGSGVLGSGGLTMYGDASSGSGMLLSTSGNLGLGTAPSSGGSIYYKSFELGKAGCGLFAATNSLTVSELTYLTGNAVLTYSAGPLWTRGSSGPAAVYGLEDGNHKWFVGPDGTAGTAISFTQAMTLDASGNLGLGTTSPASYGKFVNYAASGPSWNVVVSGANQLYMGFDSSVGVNAIESNGVLMFATRPGFSESARISSNGEVLIGCTSAPSASVPGYAINVSDGTGDRCFSFGSGLTSGDRAFAFFNPNGMVGSITTGGSSTNYNTSSDARLKDNISPASDASALIDAIQVRQFDWKTDGSHQRYGFVAQELEPVFPEAVSKTSNPDATMGVDYSKLVPLLVKEVQALRARVAALESI